MLQDSKRRMRSKNKTLLRDCSIIKKKHHPKNKTKQNIFTFQNVCLVVVDGILNPFFESGNAGVDSWLVGPSASIAPRNNAQNSPFAVDLLHQGTARITLTAVLSTNSEFSGANHRIADLASVILAPFARAIGDERHGDGLKDGRGISGGRQVEVGASAAPTRDGHDAARSVIGIFIRQLWQAGGLGVAVEAQILTQFEQSDVILLAAGSVLRVSEMTLDVDLLFGSFGVAQIVLTSDNFHSGATAGEAVSRRQNPSFVDDSSSAEVAPRLDAHLPGEGSSFHSVTANDVST